MNHFMKAAAAVALLAGANSASAAIAYDQGGLNEAYLSAYDSSTGKTFVFDTGITINELVANVTNAAYAKSFDFTNDGNWSNFITGADTSRIKWIVAVGNSIDFVGAMTLNVPIDGAAGEALGSYFGFAASSAIQNHAIDINTDVNNALNLSKLVKDSDPAGTGQHANAADLWAGWIQDGQAKYGESIGFQLGGQDLSGPNGFDFYAKTFVGKWTLAGNSLSYAAANVPAVPVPGAVWLFGTGLAGLLGLRRKAA